MDETTRAAIDAITVSFSEPRKIPSGQVCSVFYDCVRLSPNDLARLAAHAVGHLPEESFDVAVGIAYNGILFASAVAGGRHVAILCENGTLWGVNLKGKKVMLVDDVVHSGSRLRAAETLVLAAGAEVVGYACIINRAHADQARLSKPLWSAFAAEMR